MRLNHLEGIKRLWGFVFAALILSGCWFAPSIKVGLAAELSDGDITLGTAGRNGVLLAVEEINAAGGINGRQVDLLVMDDQGNPDTARAVDQQLIDAGVVAIIGHSTSGITMAGLEVTQPAGVVMVSPTASTVLLSEKEDLFFRVTADNSMIAYHMAAYLISEQINRISVVYDSDNQAYAWQYAQILADEYGRAGGTVLTIKDFSTRRPPDYSELLEDLKPDDPQALVVLADGLHSALFAQHARLIGWDVPLYASHWAYTDAILQNGGSAVEGVQFITNHDATSQTPEMLAFSKRYQERFGEIPNFSAVHAYDAARYLFAALEDTRGRAEGLPDALLNVGEFQGVQEVFEMNVYGDVIRPLYVGRVEQGQLVTVNRVED